MNAVRWSVHAEADLTEIWMRAGQATRARITSQTADFETRLRGDAEHIGEGRGGLNRVALLDDVVIEFQVRTQDWLVIITKIRPRHRRS